MKFSQEQIVILGFLVMVVVVLVVLGSGLVIITYWPQLVLGDISPTQVELMPTAFISVPTYAPPSIESPTEIAAFTPTVTALSDISATRMVFSTPTQEIYPSITPVKVIQINTPIPNIQPQNPPQQNPPSQNSSSQSTNNCSSQLAYAKSVHQYNLARINQIYQPLIDFYQSMINQAVAERDAIGLNDYKRKLDSQKNQLNNAIKAENQRYQGEISYINSTCK